MELQDGWTRIVLFKSPAGLLVCLPCYRARERADAHYCKECTTDLCQCLHGAGPLTLEDSGARAAA